LLKSSSTTNNPTVRSGATHPVEIAIDRPIGIAAANHGPMKGINLNVVARIPHRMALGTPIRYSPPPTQMP